MTSKNDITGDEIKTKLSSDNYRDGWDRIFGNKQETKDHLQEDEHSKNDRDSIDIQRE